MVSDLDYQVIGFSLSQKDYKRIQYLDQCVLL